MSEFKACERASREWLHWCRFWRRYLVLALLLALGLVVVGAVPSARVVGVGFLLGATNIARDIAVIRGSDSVAVGLGVIQLVVSVSLVTAETMLDILFVGVVMLLSIAGFFSWFGKRLLP